AQLREVAQQRLLVAALQLEVVPVTEHDAAEAVPLRFVQHVAVGRQLARQLGEHGLERRLDRQCHQISLLSDAQRASWWRLESCSFRSTDDTCVSTVFTLISRSRATSLYA